MRKTAGFLKFCCTFALVIIAFAALCLAFAFGFLAISGSLSEIVQGTSSIATVTIDSGNMTPQELDALKPVILIVLGTGLLSAILAIIGTLKTRTALTECKEERPFSQKCVDSLKASARMELLSGIVAVASSVAIAVMASKLTVNGASPSTTTTSISLTFLFYAVMKYLLYHVANYGHSLERDPRRR